MFDGVMDSNDAGLLELTRRLESYADARLTPSAAATIRMRTALMNAAQRHAALTTAETTRESISAKPVAAVGQRRRTTTRRLVRPAAALMAASLTLALLAGTVYGAKPGGPLYATRLWVEAANLPRTPLARAEAEGVRLDTRIAEAQEASADGDAPAAEAALSAYSVIVVEAVQGAAGDPTANAAIESSVARHVVVLNQLVGTVPAHAREAVESALISSSNAIQELSDSTNGNNGHQGGPATSGGAAAPGASGSPQPIAEPEATPGNGAPAEPSDATTPDKTPPARDHQAPPAGHSRGGGRKDAGQPAHSTPTPNDHQTQSSGAGQHEAPIAP